MNTTVEVDMSDFLGFRIPTPKTKAGKVVASVALLSIPVAAVVGLGVIGVRAIRRLKPESEEELAARLERASHLHGQSADE